jgi:ferredoxin
MLIRVNPELTNYPNRRINVVKITAEGKTFEVAMASNLRESLLDRNINLYNSGATILNCHGHGTCGTCLVQVEGNVSAPTQIEKIRMALPPNSSHPERRLSCQVKVMGDVRVTKFDDFFGTGEHSNWTPDLDLNEVAIAK